MNRAFIQSRRLGLRFLCLAVSAVALWLIWRKIDPAALQAAILNVRPGWFLFAFALFGLDLALAAARWHVLLRIVGHAVHFGVTVRSVFIGHFFNTLLLGPAGGDVAKSAWYARWYGFSGSELLASCFLDRIIGGGGHLMFLILTFVLAALGGVFGEVRRASLPAGNLGIGLALLLVFLIACIAARHRLPARSPVVRTLNAFLEGVRKLWEQRRLAVSGLLLSFFVQVLLSAVLAVCLQSVVHRPLPWMQLLWTFPLISLVSSVPLTFSGAGLREGAALVLLGYTGIAAADAVAAALLTLIVYLLWAVVGAWLYSKEKRRLTRAAEAQPKANTISVVIPTLNEEEQLPKTIACLRRLPEVIEIFVADGGSTDGTVALAEKLGCPLVHASRGRGRQMRAGAERAGGDVVLLLHADTLLPPGSGRALLDALRDPTTAGGGFWKVFDRRNVWMAGSRFRCALRLFIWGRIAGDQGFFVRRTVLEQVGGVPDLPLMEEFELSRRIRRVGRLALASATVVTSARRFAKLGVLRTYMRMWRVTAQYYMGTPAKNLRELYERD